MMNFISLSIKTANQWPDSICAIELIKIENNEVTDSLHSYIHTNQEFDPFYTSLHGIEQADIQNSPTFAQFAPILHNWLEQQNVVSFYQPYEALCIQESYDSIGQLPPTFIHRSVLPFAKQNVKQLPSYTLHDLVHHLDLAEQASDAERLAQVVITLLQKEKHGLSLLHNEIIARKEPLASLQQKTVVFTGGLHGLRRSDAAKLVMRAGGFFSNTMSKKVDILVISMKSQHNFEQTMHQSSKWRLAITLQQSGHPIDIITEEDFLTLIQ